MEELPHHYCVTATAATEGLVAGEADSGVSLGSSSPVQFGGEPGHWTPEHLLTYAVVSCFVLTFKAIARASQLPWLAIRCEGTGTLDKVERQLMFTAFRVEATVTVSSEAERDKVLLLMQKAEKNCLVTNSLKCPVTLDATVLVSA